MFIKIATSGLFLANLVDQACAFGWGWCPEKPEPTGNFDVQRYMGRWYEIKRDKDVWYQQNNYCVNANYAYNDEKWIYKVSVNNQNWLKDGDGSVKNSRFLGIEGTSISNARCEDNGNCYVKFWWYPEGSYQVLDTDYDNYALVYGCDSWVFFYTQQAWLL